MSTAVPPQPVPAAPAAPAVVAPPQPVLREVRVYSHSPIFYWWPVWAVGYLLALLTWLQGESVQFHDFVVRIHPNHTLGVIFTFTVLLVILMTHFSVRGIASLAVILGGIALFLFIAYMGWWDDVLRALGNLAIFMNLGFYFFFSTCMFIVWALAVFVFVRLNYYIFRPGQLIHVRVWGGGEESFDTRGMSVLKMQDDLFRHWVLGLGSGDMHVATTGARKADFVVHNVLFIGWKLEALQKLVATKPDETPDVVAAAPTAPPAPPA
jgi:hypothetical protein